MSDQKNGVEHEQLLAELRQWCMEQPHITKDFDDKLLLRFLHSCFYDIDKAKTTMEHFVSIRTSIPDILTDRDPMSPRVQKTLDIVNLGQYSLSGNRNLWIWQLNDPGLEKYDYVEDARLFFITMDVWLLAVENLEEGDIAIMDVKDISIKFLTKFNMQCAKMMSKYQENALPIRLKEVHILNAAPYIDKIFNLMKPFMNKETANLIHFHVPNSDTIFKYLKKEELPEDFGGTLGKLADQKATIVENLIKNRDQLNNNKLWRFEKKSKKKDKVPVTVTVPDTSFRSLAID